MEKVLAVIVLIIIAEVIFSAIRYTRKTGIKYTFKLVVFTIKSPVKSFRFYKSKRLERKEFKVNRTIWLAGVEQDKIDNLLRYKSDARIMNSAKVKLSFNKLDKINLKDEVKSSNKENKDKKFDKITR